MSLWIGAGAFQAQELTQKYARKETEKGPRALGLIQLSSTGKARIIPVVIMMDGKFYDAASYKASPVPMALDFGVVYEAFKAGVSQGTLTITQPGQLNHNWIAEGTWLPAGVKPPQSENTRKYAPPVIEDDSKSDRPVLHRRTEGVADKDKGQDDKTKDEGKPSASPTAASPTSAPPAQASSTTSSSPTSAPANAPSSSGSPTSAPTRSPSTESKDASKDANPAAQAASKATAADEPIQDPNRPRLRRGKPDPNAHHEPFVNFDAPEETAKSPGGTAPTPKDAAPTVQTITAISDTGGPDPRPYTYDVKPAEEAIYRNKMLALASTLVKLKPGETAAPQISPSTTARSSASSPKKPSAAKATPQFEDVNLRIFDLSNSNEPVLVLSARTPLPPQGATASQVPQEITLVARTNLEGELQKLFLAQTDSRHLDVKPRMELIDAVDADGDGRGELLFRETSDAGSAYAIYRVTADQLWPLYEGTP